MGSVRFRWVRLGNVWGSRRAIPFFAVTWSLGTALMALAGGMPLLVASRVASGLAQAGLFPSCTLTIAKWFPDTVPRSANGALAGFMSLGGALGVAITGVMLTRFGWRMTFAAYSTLGFVFAAIFYFWFRDTPSQHRWANQAERVLIQGGEPPQFDASSGDAWGIYFSPATWWICGQQFCRAAGQIFFSSWFATYLQETRNVSVERSGFLNSLPLVGIVAGSFIGGRISDSILREHVIVGWRVLVSHPLVCSSAPRSLGWPTQLTSLCWP